MLNNIGFANYVDDTAPPYVFGDDVKQATDSLKNASDELFCWFTSNQMKANRDKCHPITSCDNEMSFFLNNYNINSKCQKLLGNKIDHKLNLNTYIDEICKTVGQTLNASSKATLYMDLPK